MKPLCFAWLWFLACTLLQPQSCFPQTVDWNRSHENRLLEPGVDGNFYCFSSIHDHYLPPPANSLKKVSPHGQVIWSLDFPEKVHIRSVTAAPDSGCFAIGTYRDSFYYGGLTLPGESHQNLFVARFAANGQMLWAINAQSPDNVFPGQIKASNSRILITGIVNQTLSLDPIVLDPEGVHQMFIATLDFDGKVLAGICSKATTTTSGYGSASVVESCGFDARDNIYLLTRVHGRSVLGGSPFGRWLQDNDYGPYTTNLFKLDAELNVLRNEQLYTCNYSCAYYSNLVVTKKGTCYFGSNFRYGQSGADDQYARIYRMDQESKIITYDLSPSLKSGVSHLSLDDCENVLYTGYTRTSAYSGAPMCHSFTAGSLSPDLKEEWTFYLGSCGQTAAGHRIFQAGSGACYVSGVYDGTLNMPSTLTASVDGGYFLCRIQGWFNEDCSGATGMTEKTVYPAHGIKVMPNPASSETRVRASFDIREIRILDLTGVVLRKSEAHQISVSGLLPGLYFINVEGMSGEYACDRLIVE